MMVFFTDSGLKMDKHTNVWWYHLFCEIHYWYWDITEMDTMVQEEHTTL